MRAISNCKLAKVKEKNINLKLHKSKDIDKLHKKIMNVINKILLFLVSFF